MKIAVLVEGSTELALKPHLLDFLAPRLLGKMPRLQFVSENGRVPTGPRLKFKVEHLLKGRDRADAVIALSDVYTGTGEFRNAAHAKSLMSEWVGSNPRFHPHVASHEFEAWLLPFWGQIQHKAGEKRLRAPKGAPEKVNHRFPPSFHIRELFRLNNRYYSKPKLAAAILTGIRLREAASRCPELKGFLNTLLTLPGGEPLD